MNNNQEYTGKANKALWASVILGFFSMFYAFKAGRASQRGEDIDEIETLKKDADRSYVEGRRAGRYDSDYYED